jgi:hypothetical protein
MAIEDMVQEENRIRKLLEKAVPGTTEYQNLKNDLTDIVKMRVEAQKVEDLKVDQNFKRDLEERRMLGELDNQKSEIEARRRHDILDIAKVGLAILGSLAGIVLTGHLEETQILSQKCFSWIQKPKY